MTCFHPLKAWRSLTEETPAGRSKIVFRPPAGPAEPIELACGQCMGCRIARSREWAVRCVHEASLHEDNCFVTLTYSPEHLPQNGSLVKKHHQDWLKRLRSRYFAKKIRYFLCGEYGSSLSRPHYHALLFGFRPVDLIPHSRSGEFLVYISPDLSLTWPHGYVWVGDVTWESAAYVARYCLKKVNGAKAWEHYVQDVDTETGEVRALEPEYVAMSRRPGLGAGWFADFGGDVHKGYVTISGRRYGVPRYYDHILERTDLEAWARRRLQRRQQAAERAEPPERLPAIEEYTRRQCADRLKRRFEE